MHAGMSIRFSCDHSVDFVRSMIPHHKGAVAMCAVLTAHAGAAAHLDPNPTHAHAGAADPYLAALCANITRMQVWVTVWECDCVSVCVCE